MATHQGLGEKAKGGMNEPENLKRVLAPLHYLNQESPSLLKTPAARSIRYPYLTRLLAAGSGLADLESFTDRLVSPADRLAYHARVTMNRDPQAAL
ncbi:MAG: hypothetical protein GWO24_05545, partial [Akkermansiaceae bacterium]|nr:hypothetical protein [Akkermansiaceae bacterium]